VPTTDEILNARGPFAADAAVGVEAISDNQEVVFDLYVRLVLPVDGYVFWVKASILSPSALYNTAAYNTAVLNQGEEVITPTDVDDLKTRIVVKGSLHYNTVLAQEEDANYSINRMVFTALDEVNDLNEVRPDFLYMAEFEGQKYAFSSSGSYYLKTRLWHYVGNAVYPTMRTQVVDNPSGFNPAQVVVSNSLPAWLALNQYAPVYPVPLPQPRFMLYPSFLSPNNQPPIYGTVHIDPAGTMGLQAVPSLGSRLTHTQLARDRVVVTLYGCSNDLAATFLDSVLQYSVDTDGFGIMNVSPILDDKKTQNELGVIAMKKRIIFDVSYNQISVRNIARQMVESCLLTYYPTGVAPGPPVPPITDEVQLWPLATSMIAQGDTPVVVASGPMLGGFIVNPRTRGEQNVPMVETLFVSFTGSADDIQNSTTFPVQPGQRFNFPANLSGTVSVNATTAGHRFAGVVYQRPPPTFMKNAPTTITPELGVV
jgi:hypothetical protein